MAIMYHFNHPRNIMMLLTLSLTLTGSSASSQNVKNEVRDGYRIERIVPERLPDLNIPRSGHHTVFVNGELTVMGGHTTAFVPTPTLEYYSDGAWHVVQMAYPHDAGLLVPMSNGKLLIGGGFEKPLGIGQLHSTEVYDPLTHSFSEFGCLDVRRASACGMELGEGRVLITGNWYHRDTMEIYDGKVHYSSVKAVTIPLFNPYVFRSAKDNAVIFGIGGTKGDTLHINSVDQLKGNAFRPALFETWQPLKIHEAHQSTDYEVGDTTIDDYSYLFPMTDSTGQVAIGICRNGDFSLLPTAGPIPMKGPDGKEIRYLSLIVDKPRQRVYLRGDDRRSETETWEGANIVRRHYLLRIDYAQALQGKGKAPLTLYYTDKMDVGGFDNPTVTPNGDVVLAGGKYRDNYTPLSTVYVFRLGDAPVESASVGSGLWQWILVALLVLFTIGLACWLIYSRRQKPTPAAVVEEENDNQQKVALMKRVCQLMDEQKLYLNSDLKIQDVASQLGVHPNVVSAAINSQGNSFNQFVNDYRIEYAKRLLLEEPDKKVSSIYYEVGFGHEQTFFRAFKARIGMTPSEWKKQESTDKM